MERIYVLGFGAFLLLIAISIVVSTWRTTAFTKKLNEESNTLAQELLRLKEAQEQSRIDSGSATDELNPAAEEESRIRERLDIPQEGGTPASREEVVAGAQALQEDTAQKYSRRLEALNDIAVSTLHQVHHEIIVSKALAHLADIIDYDFARVVEFDQWKGKGMILGTKMDSELEIEECTGMPISYYRGRDTGDRDHRYIKDLSEVQDRSDLEQDLLDAGLHSCFRQALHIGDEVIGVVTIGSRKKGAFSKEDMQSSRDIIDLVSLSISMSRYNAERDRYEAELIASKDRAEEMAKAKTTFLSNMSHEIRTPLTGIIGFAQVMQQELDGEMHEFASLIYSGGKRLLNTINSVLDFAKLEAGQLSMVASPTDVNETIREAIEILTPLAVQKDLMLQVSLLEDPLYCTLDKPSLERIITNLVGNAIKFTEVGIVEVVTEITEGFGRIVISDTGIGISADFMPNLFNEFYQEDMGPDREHEGSGLGLAITRRLVDKMGGWIEVENREVRGTIFSVTFPLSITDENSDEEQINSVLVVSDAEELDFVEYAQLQHELDVQTAPNLKSAVRHARHRRFDLVVVHMRNIDPEVGITRVRAVRDIPEYDTVPFVALSDEPFSDDDKKFLECEFDGFSDEPGGTAAYLLRIIAQNKETADASEEASRLGDENDPKWEDDESYGDDFDASRLFDEGEQ